MNTENTNLKRIPDDKYQIKRKSDGSIEIIFTSEYSEMLNLSDDINFKIQNDKIRDTSVITLQSDIPDKVKLSYN